jgi:hypothetical protein
LSVDFDGLVDLPPVLEADSYVDKRIQVKAAHVGSLLFQTDDLRVLLDGELVFANDAVKVGEVVVADGVIGVAEEGRLVAALCLSELAERAIAVAHVAVGLEVLGLAGDCQRVELDCSIVVAVQLFILPLLEVILAESGIGLAGRVG